MVFDFSVALTWILFLALFPMAFFWLRRAWRILFRRDFSEVALKRGEPPPDPEKWAPYAMAINLVAGAVVVGIIVWWSWRACPTPPGGPLPAAPSGASSSPTSSSAAMPTRPLGKA